MFRLCLGFDTRAAAVDALQYAGGLPPPAADLREVSPVRASQWRHVETRNCVQHGLKRGACSIDALWQYGNNFCHGSDSGRKQQRRRASLTSAVLRPVVPAAGLAGRRRWSCA
jgi:hypothetical protein